VARAAGVNLPENIVDRTLKAVDGFPAEATSSLTRDVWEGKPSEIETESESKEETIIAQPEEAPEVTEKASE